MDSREPKEKNISYNIGNSPESGKRETSANINLLPEYIIENKCLLTNKAIKMRYLHCKHI